MNHASTRRIPPAAAAILITVMALGVFAVPPPAAAMHTCLPGQAMVNQVCRART